MFRNYQIAYCLENVKMRESRRLSFLRQCVAYSLSQSAKRIPHAAGISEFDVTPLVEYGRNGERIIAESEEPLTPKALFRRAIHRNFSAFFIKAFAHALYHVPELNGVLEYSPFRSDGTLHMAEDINIGFTVHSKFGVIKPILKNAHMKTIETVAKEMRDLSRRARRTDANELYGRVARTYLKTAIRQLDLFGAKALWIWLRHCLWPRYPIDPAFRDVAEEDKLKPEDVLGATVTIANIGMMVQAHQTVTVIIPPEVMMFGIGDLHLAPLVVDGKVAPRSVVTVAATLDHRALDGGDVFPLVEKLRQYIDEPGRIYEWKPGDEI